jgi:hypothetical protein
MADTKSRNSIFFVALPSLLLIGMIGLMGLVLKADRGSDAPAPNAQAASLRLPPDPAADNPAEAQAAAAVIGTRCGADEPLAMNRPVLVQIVDCRRPLRLRYGNLRISAMWREPRGRNEIMDAVVTVRRLGLRPQRIVLGAAIEFGLLFNIGRLNQAGDRYVMVQAFGGGPHCCVSIDVAIPEGRDRGAVHLGDVDTAMTDRLDPAPTDLDGDGRIDFVVRDNRFFYEFTGYGGTALPPLRIWNIRRGRIVEVSTEPRFRTAFQQDVRERRATCLQGRDEVRSACPAYIATEARLGRFRSAWRDMLRVYDPARDDNTITEHFPRHLRQFLRTNGYLRA